MSTWLSRNRWGLILLPFAIVLALLASSSRVQLFWWNYGPHEVTEGRQGSPVSFSQEWMDRAGKHTRSLTVTVTSIAPADKVILENNPEPLEVTVPKGSTLWRVDLSVRADPMAVLWGCQMSVLDSQGREFEATPRLIEPSFKLKVSPCTPEGARGPAPVLYDGMKQDADELDRPESYTTSAYLPMTNGAVPKTVRLWWEFPKVIEIAVTPSEAAR